MTLKDDLLPKKKKQSIRPRDLLSTGSTLLNLACSGRADGGFLKGKYVWLVGDSSSGKTFLSMTCLAEAALNKYFDSYRFIYDNVEDGMLMDVRKYFGSKVEKRLEPPHMDKQEPVFSSSIEEFYYNVDDAIKLGKPFIYILDSMDGLSSESEIAKFDENKKAFRKGKAGKGSYGDGKAKINSSGIRQLIARIRDSGSILIVISQTRDNIGFGAQFNPQTAAGGKSLKFYATLQLWSSIRQRIKKDVNKKKRQVGIICRVAVKKNRLTGKERTIDIPIYTSSGIDDVMGCINYLVDENHWTGSENSVSAKEFKFSGNKDDLCAKILKEDLLLDLKSIVMEVWEKTETSLEGERKSRYDR